MKKNILLAVSLLLSFQFQVSAQWSQLPNLSKNVISLWQSNTFLLAGTDTGIYYTSNNGNTWNLASGIASTAKSFTEDGSKLFVSSYEKLYQSINDGSSWSAMPTIYTNQAVSKIVMSDTNYVAGMNGNGIWFSVDKGSAWWSSSTSWQGHNTDIVVKKNLLFASYHGSGYLQASSTHGQTWYSPSGNGIKIGLSSSYQDIYCLAVKNDSILIAGTKNNPTYDGVYFSNDNGNNWTKKNNGITTTAVNSLVVIGNLVFAGTNGGGVFYTSDDGNNWTSLNVGLTNLNINKLYINGSTLYAGVPTGVFMIDICNLLKNTSTIYANGSTTISSGDSVKLFANLSGTNYQWILNNTVVSNSNNNVLFANSNGNYKAVISYSSNCYDTTNVISITINPNGLTENLIQSSSFQIYPNPSTGSITFEFTASSFSDRYQILFYDITGSLLKSFNLLNNQSQLTIDELQSGIYYCVIQNKTSSSKAQKVILIK